MAILKICRCGKYIKASDRLCDECMSKQSNRHKAYDIYARDKRSSSFYKSAEWLKIRRQALARDNNLCVNCLSNNNIKQAYIVDHIVPIKVDWSKRLVLSNMQCLCLSCHNTKTSEDKKKYNSGGI